MPTVSLLLAGLASVLHLGFFAMESLFFRRPAVYRRFGVGSDDVEVVAFAMLNQGFYNLFLGLGTLVGVVGAALDWEPQGSTLVAFGCLFMVGAALVLGIARPALVRAAFMQGVLPALALVTAVVLA